MQTTVKIRTNEATPDDVATIMYTLVPPVNRKGLFFIISLSGSDAHP